MRGAPGGAPPADGGTGMGEPPGAAAFQQHLGLVASLNQDLAGALDVELTIQRAIERIALYLDAEGGALFLLNDAGDALRCHACVGPVDIVGLTLGARQGIVGRSVTENQGQIVRDVASDPHFHSEADAESGFTTRSILCAPMTVKEVRVGAIELVNKRDPQSRFSLLDLKLLEAFSATAALAILNARMAVALLEQERIRRELELAARIQRNLLPAPPEEPLPVYGVNHPARTVSGDFFDYFVLADGRIRFCLGDVSGKGMNAALLMAKTASLFHCLAKEEASPGRLLARINGELVEKASHGMFVTMVAGIHDPLAGRVVLANAGHEPPLLVARDGSVTPFPAQEPPLGIMDTLGPGGNGPAEEEIWLDGGTLYLFTDGLSEGRPAGGGAPLGAAGVGRWLAGVGERPLAERIDGLCRLFIGAQGLHDDLTLLGVADHPREGRVDGRRPEGDFPDGQLERVVELRLAARADNLKRVRALVREVAEESGLPRNRAGELVLAVDEACQNVIRHAYGGQGGELVLEIRRDEAQLVFRLRDEGVPADPRRIRPRALGDLRPGGLGTFFIGAVMDRVDYLRPANGRGNVLRLVAKRA